MPQTPSIKIVLDHPEAKIPTRATTGSAGYDLYAAEDVTLLGFNCSFGLDSPKLVDTGIKIQLPPGYEAQIRPRSGLALKGIRVANSPGTVDEDFTGRVKVILQYTANWPPTFEIKKGDKIAQMVITKYETPTFEQVDTLDPTVRGEGGFGSTGTR